jgi:hypothetical protein
MRAIYIFIIGYPVHFQASAPRERRLGGDSLEINGLKLTMRKILIVINK